MKTCTECPLHEGCQTNNIRPVGDDNPHVVFVLESPSSKEDEEGRAMVSEMERKLMQLVKQAGLSKYRIKYTKAIRCFPAGSNIGVRMLNTCRETHLLKELKAWKPEVIVAVGTKSLLTLTGKSSGITSVSGTVVESSIVKSKVFALISPNVLIYNPDAERRIKRDLGALVDLLRGKKSIAYEPTIEIASSAADVRSALRSCSKGLLSLDFETSHKTVNPFKDAEITCLSISNEKDEAFVIPFPEHPDCPKELRKFKAHKREWDKYHDFDRVGDLKSRNLSGPYLELFEHIYNHKRVVAYNAATEVLWSTVMYRRPRVVYDPMLMLYQLDPDRKGEFGLDDATMAYFPEAGRYWEKIPSLKNTDTRDIPGSDLFPYCAMDTLVAMRLVPIIGKALSKKFDKVFDWKKTHYFFTHYVVPMLARLQYNGWYTDENQLVKVQRILNKRLDKLEHRFQAQPEVRRAVKAVNKIMLEKHEEKCLAKYEEDEEKYQKAIDRFKPIEKLNTKSTKHVQVWLFKALKNEEGKRFKPPLMTAKGNYTTQHKSLEPFLKQHFGVDDKGQLKCVSYAIRHEINQIRHALSTYVNSVIDRHLTSDGYLHCSYLQHGTGTGRLSSRDPNGQNFPERNKPLARLLYSPYVSRFKGGKIIGADFGQIEPRVACAYGNDKAMREIFEKDLDIYLGIAYGVFAEAGTALASKKTAKKDLDEKQKKSKFRFISKQVTLAVLYEKQAFSLAEDLGMDIEDAESMINGFYKKFRGIAKYKEKMLAFAKYHKFVITKEPVFARMVPKISYKDDSDYGLSKYEFKRRASLQAQDERIAVNTPIQGVASFINLIAAHWIIKRLRKEKLRAPIMGLVHDADYYDSHPKDAKRVAEIVADTKENIAKIDPMLKWLDVPLKADVKIGDCRSDLVEDD